MASQPDDIVRAYFADDAVLAHYLRATAAVGLWKSEEILIERYFKHDETLLEVGCGTGRIAFGMHELGFRHVRGVDLSREMIEAARNVARSLEYGVGFEVADACALPFEEGRFEGAIFGFNGLMQIPLRARRQTALREIRRVLANGSYFFFTSHDRRAEQFHHYWTAEEARWKTATQDRRLQEFGDLILATNEGELFIHIPSEAELREDLEATGWTLIETTMRDDLVRESRLVRDFADECRLWVARKETTSRVQ